MLDTYGDSAGIPVVKTSRFWSVMITAGQYIYPRLTMMQEFAEKFKQSTEGIQLGSTLTYAAQNWGLFEFDCRLSHIDHRAFHAPFNYNAQHINQRVREQPQPGKVTREKPVGAWKSLPTRSSSAICATSERTGQLRWWRR